MSDTPPNPARKTQDDSYSNQSNHSVTPGQKVAANINDRSPSQQKDGNKSADANKAGGMKNDPQSSDPRRDREEEDRPRADSKVGNK